MPSVLHCDLASIRAHVELLRGECLLMSAPYVELIVCFFSLFQLIPPLSTRPSQSAVQGAVTFCMC